MRIAKLNLVLMVGLLTLVACGGSGGDKKGGGGGDDKIIVGGGDSRRGGGTQTTVTEAELNNDTQALNASETDLSRVGLRYQIVGNRLQWDENYYNNYLANAGLRNDQVAGVLLPRLQAYVGIANKMMQKYGNGFNLKKGDGTTEASHFEDAAKQLLQAKINVANQTIGKLQGGGR